MTVTISQSRFIEMFKPKPKEVIYRYAMVAPDYVSGRPALIFDGEETQTTKTYQYNVDLTFAPNDIVLLVGNTIICKISR